MAILLLSGSVRYLDDNVDNCIGVLSLAELWISLGFLDQVGRGIIKWWVVSLCPTVCPSVCRVSRPNSRTGRSRKPKIDRMEAHHTCNSENLFRGQNVKVTRPINAVTESVPYLLNWNIGTQLEHKTRINDKRHDL